MFYFVLFSSRNKLKLTMGGGVTEATADITVLNIKTLIRLAVIEVNQ